MKKLGVLIKIISVFALVLFFGGCNTQNSKLELKNRLIVQGIGIDKSDGMLSVSVQALNTDVSSNSASSGAPEEVVKCYSVSGRSVSEAISKLSDITGSDPLISQNRIVVFGHEFAEDGIADYLDDFVRTTENRITVYVAVADGKADDIIFSSLGENIIPARRAEQIIRSSDFNANVVSTRAFELINAFSDGTASATLPVLKCVKDGENDVLEVSATALFKDEKLICEKDDEIATGILWANDRIGKGEISFEGANGVNITANIIKSGTKIKTEIRDGKPCFDIKIKCSLDLSEVNKSVFEIMEIDDINEVGEYAERAIENYVENSINECIMKESADVFGFGRRLKRTCPSFYKSNVSDWSEMMKNCEYNTQVDVKIERVGGSVARLYK